MLLLPILGVISAAPDPYAIYARTRAYWQRETYPAYLTYSVTVSALQAGRVLTNTYRSFADTATGEVKVRATSREEASHPYVPHGATLNTTLNLSYAGKAKLGAGPTLDGSGDQLHVSKTIRISASQQYDVFGVPQLSPAYAFGLLAPDTKTREDALTSAPGMKVIVSVRAVRRDYAIAYEGTATVDGSACYHLRLSPLRDPLRLRLRELWVDESSYATRAAVVQGNFTAGPGPKLPWKIRFTQIDGRTYISDETALAPVHYLDRSYAGVRIAFDGIAAAGPPDVTWRLSLFKTSGDILREPRPQRL